MRIASFISSATEILYALGLGDQVVGVSHECDFPVEVKSKPKVSYTNITPELPSVLIDRQVRELVAAGKPLYEIDVGTLIDLKPDLIVTQAQCDVCAIRYDDVVSTVAAEPELVGTTITALNPQTLGDILVDITRVGAATGREAEAARYVASLEARIDAVRERTGRLPPERRKRVCCIEWIEPLMVAANWTPELVELAGGVQTGPTLGAVTGEHSRYVEWDVIRTFDPEVIVVLPCGFDLDRSVREAATLHDLPGWHDTTAARSGNLFAVDGNALFNRSGPRIVDSLELLAMLVHEPPTDSNGDGQTWQRIE